MSSSSSEDEADQLIRLADESLRKKLGIHVNTAQDLLKRKETETEKKTSALEKAHRKVQVKLGDRKKEDKRLQATKDGIAAQVKSMEMDDAKETKKEDKTMVSKTELQTLLQNFKQAPKFVQVLFVKGQKQFGLEKYKEATDIWTRIFEEETGVLDTLSQDQLKWMGDVHGRMGFAFLQQGLIQDALACFQYVIQHAKERKYREELIIDVLNNMSSSYREIGEMDRAMETGEEAKERLAKLVGHPVTTNKEKTMDQILFQAIEGDFSRVNSLLQSKEEMSTVAQFVDEMTRVTFLMAAAGQGNIVLMQKILKIDMGTLDARDIRGHTALAWACKFGHAPSVSFLLSQGAAFTNLNTTELKTWPEQSLKALQAHLNVLNTKKTPPPPAPVTKKAWAEPLAKGKITKDTTTTVVKKSTTVLPTGFHAAPASEAAKSGKLVGRALARWDDSDATPLPAGVDNDEDAKDWDQFETNKRLFGVKSNFDEEKYTTKLDKSLSKAQKEEAERLAAQIKSMQTTNSHVAEERGHDIASQEDEEAKYGAVIGSGAYGEAGAEKESTSDGFTDAGILNK